MGGGGGGGGGRGGTALSCSNMGEPNTLTSREDLWTCPSSFDFKEATRNKSVLYFTVWAKTLKTLSHP